MKLKHLALFPIIITTLFGCHQSKIPFLQALDINADSLLMDSIPQPLTDDSRGLLLTGAQVMQLKGNAIDSFPDRILSVQRFANDYALAFAYHGMVELYLYNDEGKRLDRVELGYWNDSIKPATLQPKVVKLSVYIDSLTATYGRYHRVDERHFEVYCTTKNDTICWKYVVENHHFKLLKRTANHPVATPSRDISAYPWSQTYEVCPLINNYREILPTGMLCRIKTPGDRFSYEYLRKQRDMGAYWQWIYDHRGHEQLSDKIRDNYYWAMHYKDKKRQLPREMIEKDIQKVRNKQAKAYLLKLVRSWNNNPYDGEWCTIGLMSLSCAPRISHDFCPTSMFYPYT